MVKVIGVGRLALMAFTAVVATLVGVLVVGPWGWVAGIDVSHGPPVTGPVPAPSAEPGILYRSPDGSITIPDELFADEDHTIRFDVTARVRDDHSVVVTEDITQSFATPRHGIEREIPLTDDAGEHAMRSLEVSTDEGTPDQVSLRDLDLFGASGVVVRIGDPDRTITGVHRYRLTYVLENVVSDPTTAEGPIGDVLRASPLGSPTTQTPQTVPPSTPTDRVALDAFSTWRQDVYGVSFVVTGPPGPIGALCTQGSEFYRQLCASTALTPDGASFEATAPVSAGNDVTVQVDWPKGTFGPAVIEGPERGTWGVRLLAVGVSLVGVVLVAVGAVVRRRRLWSRTRKGVVATFGGAGETAPELVPAWPGTDAPLEFVPPMGLRPAELLRIEEGTDADASRLIASTVIDLAACGELDLVAAADDEDWVARRVGGANRPLRRYEERLMSALIPADGGDARFGDRAEAIGNARDQIIGELDDDLRKAGLLERRMHGVGATGATRVGGALVLFALTVGGAALAGLFLRRVWWETAMLLVGAGVGVAIGAWGLARVRRAGRDRTTKGLGAAYRSEGFRRFFDESEEMHARAAADAGLLRQYLGYAVAYDSIDRWVAAFDAPDLAWMGAADASMVSAWAHGAVVHRASTPPAPVSSGSRSSSGFGGGFGGGGFGGGSGGGGGGSW